MNSYGSDPCFVYKKMVTDGGGGEVMADSDDCDSYFDPSWFKSPPGYFFVLLTFMLLLF